MNSKKPTKLEKFFKILHFLEKHLYRILFPYKMYGNLKKYNKGSLLLVGNHYSIMDVVFPCMVTDRPIIFVAKQELWDKGGFMTWFVKKCKCIPAKRDGTDVTTIKECLRVLKGGGVVNIFPEGTRNHSYDSLLPFHSGAAALSIKMETPIIPIVKVNKVKFLRRTYVIVGDEIEFSKYYGKKVTKEELDSCDEMLRFAMQNMRLAFLDKYPLKLKSDKI